MVNVIVLWSALGIFSATDVGPQVVAEWDFSQGLQGWIPNGSVQVTEQTDGIRIQCNGNDGQLMSPATDLETREGDLLEVRMTASRTGDVQWFWRHETVGPYGGLLPQQSRMATAVTSTELQTITCRPFWRTDKCVIGLRFDLPEGAPGTYRVATVRILRGPSDLPRVWRREYRLPVALPRIDVASQAPPKTNPIPTDYTVAMWYFAAWEPEYTWDGWKQVAERSPWRLPLLYDSTDRDMQFNGIQFYRASTPRVIDWHVHWMREHCVNLMLWDWYPGAQADGSFDPTFFGNRALENGFLGKEKLGGPAVATNRFADTMPFAIMWTNHAPSHRVGQGLAEYIVDQFFAQPNYYRVDNKPFLPLWSPKDLISGTGGETEAKAALESLRAYAVQRGFAGVYIAAVTGTASRETLTRLGIDGAMGYNVLLGGGGTSEYRQAGPRILEDRLEDFSTQSVPGHVATWNHMADLYGRDGFVPTCPMQNWEPTLRPTNFVIRDHTPEAYAELLAQAKSCIEQRTLRKFVTIEAFNEWLEGSYVEPSTQWGMAYMEAIRDVFRTP